MGLGPILTRLTTYSRNIWQNRTETHPSDENDSSCLAAYRRAVPSHCGFDICGGTLRRSHQKVPRRSRTDSWRKKEHSDEARGACYESQSGRRGPETDSTNLGGETHHRKVNQSILISWALDTAFSTFISTSLVAQIAALCGRPFLGVFCGSLVCTWFFEECNRHFFRFSPQVMNEMTLRQSRDLTPAFACKIKSLGPSP